MSLGTVVMTGAAGLVGSALRAPLRAEAERLVLVDRVPMAAESPVEVVRRVDLSSAEVAAEVVAGADAVVHLAGVADEAPLPDLLEGNVLGAHHVLEGPGAPASAAWCWPAATG
ncbi:NAD-dependent epimerase/dehydratase family protein [Actinomadura alba]|uniref:NAD-dependent epimerase/dehydratase family protein n=1 Tax=Actinomadura alba TaxID=406431 RepID=UPI002484158E|nr:NAD-dependent epimerase/dehydratase family protein [Actinomadura alba]